MKPTYPEQDLKDPKEAKKFLDKLRDYNVPMDSPEGIRKKNNAAKWTKLEQERFQLIQQGEDPDVVNERYYPEEMRQIIETLGKRLPALTKDHEKLVQERKKTKDEAARRGRSHSPGNTKKGSKKRSSSDSSKNDNNNSKSSKIAFSAAAVATTGEAEVTATSGESSVTISPRKKKPTEEESEQVGAPADDLMEQVQESEELTVESLPDEEPARRIIIYDEMEEEMELEIDLNVDDEAIVREANKIPTQVFPVKIDPKSEDPGEGPSKPDPAKTSSPTSGSGREKPSGTNPRRNLEKTPKQPLPLPPADSMSGDMDKLIEERQKKNWNWRTMTSVTIQDVQQRCDKQSGRYRLSMKTRVDRERVYHLTSAGDWTKVRKELETKGFFSKIYDEGVCSIDLEGIGRDDLKMHHIDMSHRQWAISIFQMASPSGEVLIIGLQADCREAPQHSKESCWEHTKINGAPMPDEIKEILENVEIFKIQSYIKGVGGDAADVEKLRNVGTTVKGWVEAQNLVLLLSPQPEVENTDSVKVGGDFILKELGETETIDVIGPPGPWKGNMRLGKHFLTWPLRLQTYNTSDVLSWFLYLYRNVALMLQQRMFNDKTNVLPFIHDVLMSLVGTMSWKKYYARQKDMIRKFGHNFRKNALPWLPIEGFKEEDSGRLQIGEIKVIGIRELTRRKSYLGYRFMPTPEDLPIDLNPPSDTEVTMNRYGYASDAWMSPPKLESKSTMRSVETAYKPILFGVCKKCGDKCHKVDDCQVLITELSCEYPLCDAKDQEKNPHNTVVCPILHGLCRDCLWRGHKREDHYTRSLCTLESLFYLYQPMGMYTSWPLVSGQGHPNRPEASGMKWGLTKKSGLTASSRRHHFVQSNVQAERHY